MSVSGGVRGYMYVSVGVWICMYVREYVCEYRGVCVYEGVCVYMCE